MVEGEEEDREFHVVLQFDIEEEQFEHPVEVHKNKKMKSFSVSQSYSINILIILLYS